MANIGEPMRRHQVIPLDHPIPAENLTWGFPSQGVKRIISA
jgi:hypothetical protein